MSGAMTVGRVTIAVMYRFSIVAFCWMNTCKNILGWSKTASGGFDLLVVVALDVVTY